MLGMRNDSLSFLSLLFLAQPWLRPSARCENGLGRVDLLVISSQRCCDPHTLSSTPESHGHCLVPTINYVSIKLPILNCLFFQNVFKSENRKFWSWIIVCGSQHRLRHFCLLDHTIAWLIYIHTHFYFSTTLHCYDFLFVHLIISCLYQLWALVFLLICCLLV